MNDLLRPNFIVNIAYEGTGLIDSDKRQEIVEKYQYLYCKNCETKDDFITVATTTNGVIYYARHRCGLEYNPSEGKL